MSVRPFPQRLFLATLIAFAWATSSNAQDRTVITVGQVNTTQSCEYFREYAGTSVSARQSSIEAGRGYIAAQRSSVNASSWRSWIVRDCQDNFPSLRNSLEAAIASTGRLAVGPRGMRLEMTISDVSETGRPAGIPAGGPNDYSTSWGTALVTVAYTVFDSGGRSVHGGVLTKSIEMGRTISTANIRGRNMQPGEAVYDLIQQEVALAVARGVAFDIAPMQVLAVDGPLIEVNYGQPLLELGSILLVDKERGIGTIRYRVTSARAGTSVAEMDGDNDPNAIGVGSIATFVEEDSDAANGRRYQRVRLP
jgi:hypothetical protein